MWIPSKAKLFTPRNICLMNGIADCQVQFRFQCKSDSETVINIEVDTVDKQMTKDVFNAITHSIGGRCKL